MKFAEVEDVEKKESKLTIDFGSNKFNILLRANVLSFLNNLLILEEQHYAEVSAQIDTRVIRNLAESTRNEEDRLKNDKLDYDITEFKPTNELEHKDEEDVMLI